MNKYLISNNCTAGFIYQYSNLEYPHPFIWSTLTYYNFNKLIDDYYNLDFSNYSVEPTLINRTIKDNKSHKWDDSLSVLIDNRKLCVNYIHHHQSQNDTELRRNKVDLYYNDMTSYLSDIYKTRMERMYSNGILEPIFIFNKTIFYNKEQFYKIAYKPTKFKKIVCFPYNYRIIRTKFPDNTIPIVLPKNCDREPKYAQFLLNNYKNILEI